MADTQRDVNQGDATGASRKGEESTRHTSRTSGTNRDFDETGESVNQKHGHPREERERESRD